MEQLAVDKRAYFLVGHVKLPFQQQQRTIVERTNRAYAVGVELFFCPVGDGLVERVGIMVLRLEVSGIVLYAYFPTLVASPKQARGVVIAQGLKAKIPGKLLEKCGRGNLPACQLAIQRVLLNVIIRFPTYEYRVRAWVEGDALTVAVRARGRAESLVFGGFDLTAYGVNVQCPDEETVLSRLVADHGVAVAAHPSDAAVVARRNAREMMLRKQLRHDRKKKR